MRWTESSPAPGDNRSLQALIWVDADLATAIGSGMAAVVAISMDEGGTATVEGEVSAVAAVPPSEGTAALGSAAPVSAYRIEIALTGSLPRSPVAGTECRIVIELGTHSPVALLGMGS